MGLNVSLISNWTRKWVTEGIYPHMGGYVSRGLARLQAEGFTREEAEYWLMGLTILMTYRYGYPEPRAPHETEVHKSHVYTESEILAMTGRGEEIPVVYGSYTESEMLAMITRGETIPTLEYSGFEGRY